MNKKIIIILLIFSAILIFSGCIDNVSTEATQNTNTITIIKNEQMNDMTLVSVLHDN